jgi:hypothetical protein
MLIFLTITKQIIDTWSVAFPTVNGFVNTTADHSQHSLSIVGLIFVEY